MNRSSEERVQGFVHALEAGGLGRWIRVGAAVAALVTLALFMLFIRFKGLSAAEGMDQAQIAREVARGNGLASQFIRPIDFYFANQRDEQTISGPLLDTYHAPLWSLTNGLIFKFLDVESWRFGQNSLIFPGDRIVAAVGILFLLGAFLAAWLLARQIFDERVAWTGTLLMALCPPFWQFAMSGLAQPMVLFFFLIGMNTLFRAISLRGEGGGGWQKWLGFTAVAMGFATLAHGLVVWAMLGLLLFILLGFGRSRFWALLMLGLYLLVLAPWLIRNQLVFGMPLGKGFYTILGGATGQAGEIFSRVDPNLGFSIFALFRKTVMGFVDQIVEIVKFNGGLVIVPFFFLALLHPFKRPGTASFRWAIVLIWLVLLLGMSLFGGSKSVLDSNQLQILVTPLFVFYAVAFMLVLTTRFSTYAKLVRIAMLIGVFGLTAVPMFRVLLLDSVRVNYPPYLPPAIAIMGQLTERQENVSADIPWAVAWYADRRTLQIPNTPEAFTEISDFRRMGGPIVGLLITPYSANAPMLLDVMFGRWKPWAPFISRSNPNLRNFPCPVPITLPPENQYLALFDRKRWE